MLVLSEAVLVIVIEGEVDVPYSSIVMDWCELRSYIEKIDTFRADSVSDVRIRTVRFNVNTSEGVETE